MKLKDLLDKIVVGDAEIQIYNSLAQSIRLGEVLSISPPARPR
jgi:hypothetical protein